ncbi:MAG: ATP synthase F0 subunit B [Chloroflexi bacterium RBG_13_54_9]|nr:MAG: ATP synthase F0 subunit B [Chloroflexi bacterium RBG_13_54_9]
MDALGKLGISLPGLIGQVINFVILLGILYVVAYKPITRMLDERANRVRESMERAEFVKQQAERTEQDFQGRIEEARRQGQAVLGEAVQVGERLKEEARQEARREAEAIIARARTAIQMERDEAIAALRREVADLVVLAAEKVISTSIDKETHQRLIDEVLEVSSLKES